jgi:hypothetical protein
VSCLVQPSLVLPCLALSNRVLSCLTVSCLVSGVRPAQVSYRDCYDFFLSGIRRNLVILLLIEFLFLNCSSSCSALEPVLIFMGFRPTCLTTYNPSSYVLLI